MHFLSTVAAVLGVAISRVQGVTLTTTTAAYTVNAESDNSFQFTVSRTNCDVTSIIYRGVQVQYQGGSYSQLGSGLGSATVSATSITCKYKKLFLTRWKVLRSSDDDVDYVKITCVTDTLTHYMVVRDGDSSVHMGTYTTAGK